ncbi:replication-relaxation family protein [Kitasatospora sp. NPDC096204]|uniref:replication-relaxation family protein n=1 Tax=Kitasatospora sp. NPDC096204 TaxID=3364094 RepID=UPI00382A197C
MTKNDSARTKARARTGAEADSETREVEITWSVLAALFQFRIATAEQLRRLTAPDAGIEKMRARLRRLRDEGLAEELVLPQSGRARGWFLTEHGTRVAGAFPELADIPAPRTPGDKSAFKYTLWHQLAVVRTHLVFLADARRRGDAYGPFDFIPEITHRFAEGREGTVRPDGLLYYSRTGADGARVTNLAFVEVDRGTMGGPRLAAKLNAYARYWATAPLPAGVRPGTIEAQGGGVPLRALPEAAVRPHRHRAGRLRPPRRRSGVHRPHPVRRQDVAHRPGHGRQAGGSGGGRPGRRRVVVDRRSRGRAGSVVELTGSTP